MFKRATFATALMLCSFAFGPVFGAEEPAWLKDARARESKSLKPNAFKSKDDAFKASAPGKVVNPVEMVEGSYSVELDIGSEGNVYCEVFPEGIDLASTLRLTFGNALKEIESSQGKVEARVLENAEAGAHGSVPYISLTWLYRVATPEGAQIGAFKQFVLEKGDLGVYCAHNEIGYTRTFASIAQSFAASLEPREQPAAPYFMEISTASMSGAKIGVAVTTLERDSEGDTRARQMTAMLIATADGTVQSQDATHVDWLRSDGTLINAASTSVSNGELQNNLSLKEEDGVWTVEGEVQGKAVKTPLPKDSQPGNWVAQSREIRKILAQPDAAGREHTMHVWLDENPDKLTLVKTRILARQGDRHHTAKGEMGSVSANLLLENSTGLASTADVDVGPFNMKFERVHVSGSF